MPVCLWSSKGKSLPRKYGTLLVTLLFIDKDVLKASVVASGTLQRRVHLLGNDAMLMPQESLVSCLCSQQCKSPKENWAINGLLQDDQAQEHTSPA